MSLLQRSLSTKHTSKTKDQHSRPQWYSNPQSQQSNWHRPAPFGSTSARIGGFLLIWALFLLRLFVTSVTQLTLLGHLCLFCQLVIAFTLFTVPIRVLIFLTRWDVFDAIIKTSFNKIRNYQCYVKETFVISDSSIRIVHTLSRILTEVLRFDHDF